MLWKKHPKHFFTPVEQQRILAEIGRAEERSSGEIRVHLDRHSGKDPLHKARQVFERLGMARTRQRNGVLIYLDTDHHKFAIVGDEGIHRVVPENYWEGVKEEMQGYFRKGEFCEGLCRGIRRIGEELQAHFPADEKAGDELPDEISEGE